MAAGLRRSHSLNPTWGAYESFFWRNETPMILPLQISYRNFEQTPEAEQWVREEAAKLDKYYDRITSCRVAIEIPHAHREWGRTYHVRIDLGVPGEELVALHEPALVQSKRLTSSRRLSKKTESDAEEAYKDLHLAIRTAFKAIRRQLQDYVRRQRNEVKLHGPEPVGRILRIFPDKGYGFLESPDGREIYFHRNAVVDEPFENLQPGNAVIFSEEPGEQGPQATIVRTKGLAAKAGVM